MVFVCFARILRAFRFESQARFPVRRDLRALQGNRQGRILQSRIRRLQAICRPLAGGDAPLFQAKNPLVPQPTIGAAENRPQVDVANGACGEIPQGAEASQLRRQ